MNWNSALLAVTLASFSAAANSAPIYLACDFNNGAYWVTHSFRLDEEAGTASMTSDMGAVHPRIPAAFTAESVDIRDESTRNLRFEYKINRRTLAYTFSSFHKDYKVYHGKCRVQPTQGRKFRMRTARPFSRRRMFCRSYPERGKRT